MAESPDKASPAGFKLTHYPRACFAVQFTEGDFLHRALCEASRDEAGGYCSFYGVGKLAGTRLIVVRPTAYFNPSCGPFAQCNASRPDLRVGVNSPLLRDSFFSGNVLGLTQLSGYDILPMLRRSLT
jgi:hypothetical protein